MSWRNNDSNDLDYDTEFQYPYWKCPVKVGGSYEALRKGWGCFNGISSRFFTVKSGKVTEIIKNKDNSYEIAIEGTEFYAQCYRKTLEVVDLEEAIRGVKPWKTTIEINPDDWYHQSYYFDQSTK